MNILVTNDDGIEAAGIKALASGLSNFSWVNKVFVVAPHTEQSATSHSLTLHKPLRIRRYGDQRYSVSGTPTDCVIFALNYIVKEEIGLVISGINHGANLGNDIVNSGTVSAAWQAAKLGKPAVAISQSYDHHGDEVPDFSKAVAALAKLLPEINRHGMPSESLININVPNSIEVAAMQFAFTRMGTRIWEFDIAARQDPRGKDYHWLNSSLVHRPIDDDSDVAAVQAGKVSVTPLHVDQTNYSFLESLQQWQI